LQFVEGKKQNLALTHYSTVDELLINIFLMEIKKEILDLGEFSKTECHKKSSRYHWYHFIWNSR
jgi:hypothetical protein